MENLIKKKLKKVSPYLNEKQRRILYAAEAEQYGRGGKVLICRITGMSRPSLNRGLRELSGIESECSKDKIRKPGAGRKKTTTHYPALLSALESLVDPVSRGDPESALRWTIKSTRVLSEELSKLGYKVCKSLVSILLTEIGYSLQSNRKTLEGNDHPDTAYLYAVQVEMPNLNTLMTRRRHLLNLEIQSYRSIPKRKRM